MDIYIFKNEQQYGPYSVEQLREFVQQGHFTLDDYACWDGQNWIPLSQIPGFASQVPAGQTHQPVQAQMARAGVQEAQAQWQVRPEAVQRKRRSFCSRPSAPFVWGP